MKRFTIFLSIVFLALFAGNQMVNAQLWSLDFESAGGYTTSVAEFNDGGYDYFTRTDGSDIGSGAVYNSPQGTYFFAGQDLDGEGATPPLYINIDDIDISGQSNLQFKIYMAEDDEGTNEDWDNSDYVHIYFDIDNSGTYTNLLWIENDGSTYNSAPYIDTNFDGTGDGTEITSTFTQFTVPIAGSGSLIDIQIEFGGLTSGDEDFAIDHLEIYAGGGNSLPAITNVIQTPSSDITSTTTVSVSADVTDSDGTISLVELHWGTASGVLTNTINMSNTGGDTYTTDTDIPAQANGTTVYYEIAATDDEPETTTSPEQSYTVTDPATTTIPYSETFDADLGDCYTYSVLGTTKYWEHGTYGGNGYADINGYNSGETEEDWLVLPGINFDNYTNEIMSFDTWWNYGSDNETNYLKLYYSADYPGIGDPSGSYTWTELSYTQGAASNWTSSGYIDLSAITGTSVYIAFKYHYEVGNYRHWEIDNISIVESVPVNVTFQVNMVEETVSGDGVHVAGSFNNWDPGATLMTDPDLDDIYTVTLSLYSNREYQFKYMNGNAWGTEETVPAECQAPGTTNRFEFTSSPDYSIPVVCFSSCADCGTLFDYDITFRVDMQNEIVTGDVYLAGDFNGWADQAMTNTGGTIYELTITLTEGSYQEYKFKNGSGGWESFTGSCLVADYGNRFMTTPSANTALDLVCFNSCDACPVADFVLINEVDADDVLTDDLEFIELFDGGVGNTNLSGLVVVLFNGSDDASYLPVADLDGYFTDANGYFVIGDALVPNVDLVMSSGFLQNGADAVTLFIGDAADFPDNTLVTTTNLIDALVYDTSDADDPGLLPLLNAGQPQINEGGRGNKDEHSNQRIPNGSGGQRNTYTYDQSPPTPGAVNILMFTDWTGLVDDSNWDNPGNWTNDVPNPGLGASIPDVSKAPFPIINGPATCLSLYMAAGSSLEIGTGGSLTVINNFTNNGNLTIKSDATGTGSLIEGNGVNATVERYLSQDKWHYVSAPVDDPNTSIFTGLYMMWWDEPSELWDWVLSADSTLAVDMQGYALWSEGSMTGDATVYFNGTLHAGAKSINTLNTPGSPPIPTDDFTGFNFVGNPYPSALDWNVNDGSGWTRTSTNVALTLYIWNQTAGNYGVYVKDAGSGTNGVTNVIAPHQGFFIYCTATGSLAVDNGARIHSNNNVLKGGTDSEQYLKFSMTGNNYQDELIIDVNNEATFNFDGMYDGLKMTGSDDAPQIYSLSNDETKLSLNAIPVANNQATLPVGAEVGAAGTYVLTLTDIIGFEGTPVYLEDLQTNTIVNIKSLVNYKFAAAPGDEPMRFLLHFSHSEAPAINEGNSSDGIIAYSFENTIIVNAEIPITGDVKVYDLLGREIISEKVTEVSYREYQMNELSGYFIVYIISDEGAYAEKVYLK